MLTAAIAKVHATSLAARDLSKRPALLLIGLDGIHLRPACPRDSWLTQRGSL